MNNENENSPRRRALGKGIIDLEGGDFSDLASLDLFNNGKKVIDETPKEQIVELKIDDLRSNPYQPRKTFDENALNELAESIKENGVFQPVIVRKAIKGYEIIAGERRCKASKMAGLETVPAIIRDLNDDQMALIALLENLQRENLNSIEEALAYKRLIDEFNLTQDQVAEKVSKNRSTIGNILRLLNLCDKVQQMLVDEKLSQGHVRTLLAIEDADLQYEAAEYIFDQGLSVRETEAYVKRLLKNPKKQVSDDKKDYYLNEKNHNKNNKKLSQIFTHL